MLLKFNVQWVKLLLSRPRYRSRYFNVIKKNRFHFLTPIFVNSFQALQMTPRKGSYNMRFNPSTTTQRKFD